MGKFRIFCEGARAAWAYRDIVAPSIEEAVKLAQADDRTKWEPTTTSFDCRLLSAVDLEVFPNHDNMAGGEYRIEEVDGATKIEGPHSQPWRDKWRAELKEHSARIEEAETRKPREFRVAIHPGFKFIKIYDAADEHPDHQMYWEQKEWVADPSLVFKITTVVRMVHQHPAQFETLFDQYVQGAEQRKAKRGPRMLS